MKRKLLKQMRNEWRSNLWIAIELLIVSVVIWFIADSFYVTGARYVKPLNFDYDHTYKVDFTFLDRNSPDYVNDSTRRNDDDRLEMIERLEKMPMIEAAALSRISHPFNGSNSTTSITVDTVKGKDWTLACFVTPGFMRVFRYQGTRGESPEQLAAIIERGELVVSDNVFGKDTTATSLIGQVAKTSNDNNDYKLGAAIVPPRYSEYSTWNERVFVTAKLLYGYDMLSELTIRVKPEYDKDVREKIMAEANRRLRVGNMIITDVYSFDSIRKNFQQYQSNEIRNKVACMAFLMVNVFLGLFGTFWFRTQQRSKEIAIRKVNGASSRAIFMRLIGEGLAILTFVTVFAVGVDYLLEANGYMEFSQGHGAFSFPRILVTVGGTWAVLALMICLGVMIPAWKAMRLSPSTVLQTE